MTRPKLTTTQVTRILVTFGVAGKLTLAQHNDYVRITGPEHDRERAWHILMDQGLSCAPYPDHDDWTRR